MSEPNKHTGPYSFADIERYLQGKLSPAEMHELEKAAVQDPFLADAIEGYQSTDIKNVEEDLAYIHNQLMSEPAKIIPAIAKRNMWWQVAAASIILAVAGISGWKFFTGKNNTQEIAMQRSIAPKDSARAVTPAEQKTDSFNSRQETNVLANNAGKPVYNAKKNAVAENSANRDMINNQSVALSPKTFAAKEPAYLIDTVLFDRTLKKDLVAGNIAAGRTADVSLSAGSENNMLRYQNKQTEMVRASPNNLLISGNRTAGSANASALISQVGKIKGKGDTVKFDMEELPQSETRGYLSPKNLSVTTLGGLTPLTVSGTIAAGSLATRARGISIDTPVVSGQQQMHVTFFDALPAANSRAHEKDDLLKAKKDSIEILMESTAKTYSATGKKEAERSTATATYGNAGKESSSTIRSTAVSVNPTGGWYDFTKYLVAKITGNAGVKKESGQHGSVEIKMNISESGKVSNVRILHSFNPQLDPVIIKAIRKGPRWVSSDFLEKKDFIFKVNL